MSHPAPHPVAPFPPLALTLALGLTIPLAPLSRAQDPSTTPWIELGGRLDPQTWRIPHGSWFLASHVKPDPANPRLLKGEPGPGILVNGPVGKTSNLLSTQEFGDLELECEFLLPKGSNSGIKLQGLYEVQLFDSYGKQNITASDSGGVYPRASLLPSYHHIDQGYPPRLNAAKPPGEWQRVRILFQAPRFNPQGLKIRNARFVRVELNGILVQENLELLYPTGHAWKRPEVTHGPLLVQADHGPVAIRSLRVRPLPPDSQSTTP